MKLHSLSALLAALCLIPAASAAARDCHVLISDVQPGDILYAELAAPAPCPSRGPAEPVSLKLHFDRQLKALVATEALAAGTQLGMLVLEPGPVFRPRQQLQIIYCHGPVAIARSVRLLAPARDGDRALVKTQDGSVFSLPFEAGLSRATEGEAR